MKVQWQVTGRAGVSFGNVAGVGARRLPRSRHDLRLAEEGAELVDLARWDTANRTRTRAMLQHPLADIVAVKLVPSPPSPRLVAYERVSIARQGRSGLGPEAQRRAIGRFANARAAQVIARFGMRTLCLDGR